MGPKKLLVFASGVRIFRPRGSRRVTSARRGAEIPLSAKATRDDSRPLILLTAHTTKSAKTGRLFDQLSRSRSKPPHARFAHTPIYIRLYFRVTAIAATQPKLRRFNEAALAQFPALRRSALPGRPARNFTNPERFTPPQMNAGKRGRAKGRNRRFPPAFPYSELLASVHPKKLQARKE